KKTHNLHGFSASFVENAQRVVRKLNTSCPEPRPKGAGTHHRGGSQCGFLCSGWNGSRSIRGLHHPRALTPTICDTRAWVDAGRFPASHIHRSDQEPQAMASQPQPEWVVPNPRIPRSFGWMNLIFGSLLLLIGVGYAVWGFVAPTFLKQVRAMTEEPLA